MTRPLPPSFGDVTAEYLALKRGAGVVPDARGVVWVRGADAVSFLDGLVSQDLAGMEPGTVARSLLLSPRGKLVAPHWLMRGEAEIGLVVDAAAAQAAADALRRFKIRVDASIDIEQRPVLEVWGPGAPAVLLAARIEPVDGWQHHAHGVVAAIGFRHGGPPRWLTTGVDVASLTTGGAIPVGEIARTTVLIERGEPVMGTDVDEGTIPAEADLVDGAVSFTKGCYLGQELVARIDSRGHVNRMARGLVVAEAVLPPVGGTVVVGEDTVGEITSVGESLDLRAPIAFGLLRREVEPGSAVTITWEGGAVAATAAAFPLEPDLMQPSHSSNMP